MKNLFVNAPMTANEIQTAIKEITCKLDKKNISYGIVNLADKELSLDEFETAMNTVDDGTEYRIIIYNDSTYFDTPNYISICDIIEQYEKVSSVMDMLIYYHNTGALHCGPYAIHDDIFFEFGDIIGILSPSSLALYYTEKFAESVSCYQDSFSSYYC